MICVGFVEFIIFITKDLVHTFQMAAIADLLYVILCTVLLLISIVLCLRLCFKIKRKMYRDSVGGKRVVGFFHPYCNAGGGGERVLWVAVRAIQKK